MVTVRHKAHTRTAQWKNTIRQLPCTNHFQSSIS